MRTGFVGSAVLVDKIFYALNRRSSSACAKKAEANFKNLIGPAQLPDLALERSDTLTFSGGYAVTCALVDLSTWDPL